MEAYTDKQIARGRQVLNRAELWRRDNAQAWRYMVSIAIERAANEQTISGRALIEAARGKAFTDRMGNDTRINNNYAAIVGRWIAAEYPMTAQYIEQRRTVYDYLLAG